MDLGLILLYKESPSVFAKLVPHPLPAAAAVFVS